MSDAVCWVTTDSTCLEDEFADVVVLRDEELFSCKLEVRYDDPIWRVHASAIDALHDRGWYVDERTMCPVESGYTIVVRAIS